MKTYHILICTYLLMVACNSPQKTDMSMNQVEGDKSNKTIMGDTCLNIAYVKLAKAKLNLNKLDSIYSEKTIVLEDNIDSLNQIVQNVVCGGTIERLRIRTYKNELRKINEAYDEKFTEFISDLDKELNSVADCKVLLGKKNWYKEVGYVHYQDAIKKYRIK
ncbi:MAG: hypothetical protein ABJJ05_08915 [Maribacter litoralis]|uniref:hypothetical protein n=1 Tax=Maribacter litoralis TaxID=2059726 RepID=UPI0032983500